MGKAMGRGQPLCRAQRVNIFDRPSLPSWAAVIRVRTVASRLSPNRLPQGQYG